MQYNGLFKRLQKVNYKFRRGIRFTFCRRLTSPRARLVDGGHGAHFAALDVPRAVVGAGVVCAAQRADAEAVETGAREHAVKLIGPLTAESRLLRQLRARQPRA